MVVMTHWRHLGFEWWVWFLIWEKVEDNDVTHCDWYRCVYNDGGYNDTSIGSESTFFFKFVKHIGPRFPLELRQ